MKCVASILAAGRGSRLASFTNQAPKCLVNLCGRPLLEWQLAALKLAGIEDVTAIVGYKAECITQNVRKITNDRWRETNMVRSMFLFNEVIDVPLVISYSDIVYSPSAVSSLLRSPHEIAVAYDVNWLDLWGIRFENPLQDAESFVIDSTGRMLDIGRRVSSTAEIQGQFMGLIRVTPDGWRVLKNLVATMTLQAVDRLDTTGLLRLAINAGINITGVPYGDPWAEVDSPTDLQIYEKDPRCVALRSMLMQMNHDLHDPV